MKSTKKRKKITVIGGGTGTFVVLSGLREYDVDLTAVMSMMDSGGSNRVLRDEFGLLPTSGIRQAIVALSEIQNDGLLLRKLFDYRFHQGTGISGMTFGNLFMAALADIYGSQIKAIEQTCKLLRVKGKILPITLDDSHLVACLDNGIQILGEHWIDDPKKHNGARRIVDLEIVPPAKIYPPALEEIVQSDLIVLGPGDLYTNTIADLRVQGVVSGIKESKGKVVFIMNLMNKCSETYGYKASDFVDDLEKYLGKNVLDFVLVNNNLNFPKNVLKRYQKVNSFPVKDDLGEGKYYQIVRGDFISSKIASPSKGDLVRRSFLRHDPKKLAKAIVSLL